MPLLIAVIVIVVIVLAGGITAGAIALRNRAQYHPRLLNEPTTAREVRPLSTTPDPRFDPLPLEPEKHER